MLLRRLKDRVVQSEPDRIRCIATSATIGRGREDFPAVVRFANELFGERFEWLEDDEQRQDVVEAEREPETALGECWGSGSIELYAGLSAAIQEKRGLGELCQIAIEAGIPQTIVQDAQQQANQAVGAKQERRLLHLLLRGDGRVHRLRNLLKSPRELVTLPPEVFPEQPDDPEPLVQLIDLAVRAKHDADEAPLLPTRYHLFARALEGAFVCLNQDAHKQDEPFLFLSRQENCPHCKAQIFELAACPRCGSAYIVGRDQRDGAQRALRQSSTVGDDPKGKLAYFILTDQIQLPDEDEAVVAEQSMESMDEESVEPYTLCLGCGSLAHGKDASISCQCPAQFPHLTVYRVELKENESALSRCVACGARRTQHLSLIHI